MTAEIVVFIDFVKGSGAWESEEGWCVNHYLQTYLSSSKVFY